MEPVIKNNIITQWPQEIGQCREVAILERFKQESMYGLSAKKSGGHYRQVGAINGGLTVFDAKPVDIIPLSPNIHMQILQTDLYTFPLRIS